MPVGRLFDALCARFVALDACRFDLRSGEARDCAGDGGALDTAELEKVRDEGRRLGNRSKTILNDSAAA